MHTVSKRKFDFRAFAFFEILTLGAGLLSGFVSGTAGFERLIKPPLTPPAFVFPLVWTVLYALMAFAAYLVFNTDDIDRGAPLRMYQMCIRDSPYPAHRPPAGGRHPPHR